MQKLGIPFGFADSCGSPRDHRLGPRNRSITSIPLSSVFLSKAKENEDRRDPPDPSLLGLTEQATGGYGNATQNPLDID